MVPEAVVLTVFGHESIESYISSYQTNVYIILIFKAENLFLIFLPEIKRNG